MQRKKSSKQRETTCPFKFRKQVDFEINCQNSMVPSLKYNFLLKGFSNS